MKRFWEKLKVHHEYSIFIASITTLVLIWVGGYFFEWAIIPMALLMKIPMGVVAMTIMAGFAWICMNVLPKQKKDIDPDDDNDDFNLEELTEWQRIKYKYMRKGYSSFWYFVFFAGGLYAASQF